MPDISDSERGLPAGRRKASNPGDRLGTEARNGVLYARYRARSNTWVSASMVQLGYDRVYGPDTGYGARTGMVLGADGKPLPHPDQLEPGQAYLIPIGSTAKPVADSARRAQVSKSTRPETAVPYRRPSKQTNDQSTPDITQRPDLQRSSSPNDKALSNPQVSRRISTESADDGRPHLFTSRNATPKCYSPYPLRGEEYADILGLVAHAFIQVDYVETKKLRRMRNVHIDDSFSGLRFRNFLINKNIRKLSPAQKAAIKAYRGRRPDIVLDTGVERGFEEIKPDNDRAISEGQEQVQKIAEFFSANNLPYKFGTNYDPKPEIPVGMFFVAAEPIDVYLSCRRERGLIVYHYCFRADWNRLKVKLTVLFDLLIQLIWIILNMKDPAPGQPPVYKPPPQLPVPSPQPVIPIPIPEPANAASAVPRTFGYVPSTTLRALRSISLAELKSLADKEVDIEFEPYVPR